MRPLRAFTELLIPEGFREALGMPVAEQPRLRNEADAAWERYASTVRYGGTAEQRTYAFALAMAAEEKALLDRWAQGGRLVAAGADDVVGAVTGTNADGTVELPGRPRPG